jgi:hypothetical protein
LLYANKIAQGKGLVIPEEAKASSAAMSAWIAANRKAKHRRRGRKSAVTGTPLRIPYGNKEVALKLGARYGPATAAHANSLVWPVVTEPTGIHHDFSNNIVRTRIFEFESHHPSQAVWSPRGRGLSRRKSATSPGRPQVRLCARCRRMLARRKKAPVVITAVARELVGFIWAIAHSVNPRPIVT